MFLKKIDLMSTDLNAFEVFLISMKLLQNLAFGRGGNFCGFDLDVIFVLFYFSRRRSTETRQQRM